MTGAELKTLRESLGLSQQWMANNCPGRDATGVQLRSYQRWEAGDQPVPDDVADFILGIRFEWLGWIGRATDAAVAQIDAATRDQGAPESVDLIRYRTDVELWAAHPDLSPMPAAQHAMGLARVKELIEQQHDIDVRIVYPDGSDPPEHSIAYSCRAPII